ncbi:transcription factor CAULIFLOWER-like [Lycium barbarum]|uniref:transcription factor CAULIFLOWER-like n=1 Tax=Lycium barbarum TaxID=112863 RepID=UPI00293E6B36|nr:transcription factor CAULIFLOWER-like [Lycium barbarum]
MASIKYPKKEIERSHRTSFSLYQQLWTVSYITDDDIGYWQLVTLVFISETKGLLGVSDYLVVLDDLSCKEMGRRKIGMELIKNERSRNLTYQKRKKGLEKKADELSTLCQVKLCMIIYAPKHSDKQQEETVTIWPEKDTVRSLIESYRGRSDDDRRLRTHDLSFYFKDLARKVEIESAKLRKSNHEAKYPTWDQLYDNLSTDQLKQLTALLGAKIEVTKQRLEFLKGTQTISLEDMHAMSFLGKQATHQPNTPCAMGMMRDQNMLLSNNIVDHHQYPHPQPVCYFVPVVTPTNYYQHQYQLLPNAAATATASYQMHASQREEYYEMADHFHLPNTTMK